VLRPAWAGWQRSLETAWITLSTPSSTGVERARSRHCLAAVPTTVAVWDGRAGADKFRMQFPQGVNRRKLQNIGMTTI